MVKTEIKPALEYAIREKPGPQNPLQRVRVLEHTRGNRWKVEWIDPNPGLVHYVESRQFVATWKDHKAFLAEEASWARLRELSDRHGYLKDSAVDRALYEIFESVSDEVSYYNGTLSGSPEAMVRVRERAGLNPPARSLGFMDRGGRQHMPYGDAVDLARAFCAAEPQTVLLSAETTERKWSQEARTPGEDHMVGLLNEYRASWALIRQWAGHDAAVAQREAEIERLERLVWDAIYALQKAGLDQEAKRLRRAISR